MRYVPMIHTNAPESLDCQPGQWIDYEGARGRFYGRAGGVTWIAWGATARRRFPRFAAVARPAMA